MSLNEIRRVLENGEWLNRLPDSGDPDAPEPWEQELFGAIDATLDELAGYETTGRELRAEVDRLKAELSAYQEAEKDGRLVELPFKCEDNVWMVSANEPMSVKSMTVTVCAFDRHGRHEFLLTDWGRFVFPTKEAADEAFEKMAQEMVEAGGV